MPFFWGILELELHEKFCFFVCLSCKAGTVSALMAFSYSTKPAVCCNQTVEMFWMCVVNQGLTVCGGAAAGWLRADAAGNRPPLTGHSFSRYCGDRETETFNEPITPSVHTWTSAATKQWKCSECVWWTRVLQCVEEQQQGDWGLVLQVMGLLSRATHSAGTMEIERQRERHLINP